MSPGRNLLVDGRFSRSCAAVSALAAALAVVAPAARAETSRPPLPLYAPVAETPVETQGTGLAPDVAVRVHVDPRGRTVAVDVLDVRPSSELDGLFERAARETFLRWRFRPELREGQPVASTLEWTLRFPERREGSAPADGAQRWRRLVRAEESAQDYRRRVRALPAEQRIKLLNGVARTAQAARSPPAPRPVGRPGRSARPAGAAPRGRRDVR